MSSASPRLTPPAWVPRRSLSSASCSGRRRPMSCADRGGDAGEFGATTGRPRRVGWFDAVATKYGCMVQGATQVALTCLDVLGYLDEIPVCTGYEIDGEVTDDFPVPAQAGPRKARVSPSCPAGSATSAASPTTRICPRTPRPMWSSWSSTSAAPSRSSPPAPSATRCASADPISDTPKRRWNEFEIPAPLFPFLCNKSILFRTNLQIQ